MTSGGRLFVESSFLSSRDYAELGARRLAFRRS